MTVPANWRNPITALPGEFQSVDPLTLLPSRRELSQVRLDFQKGLLEAGSERFSPIQVTCDGVIWDGHHALRIAAEKGIHVTVKVVSEKMPPSAASILALPVE
jgi:hypothetical protein